MPPSSSSHSYLFRDPTGISTKTTPSLIEVNRTEEGADKVPGMALERPQLDKPEGDIPFELGIEDLVVGDGDEATKGDEGHGALRPESRSRPATSSTRRGIAARRSSSSSARAR